MITSSDRSYSRGFRSFQGIRRVLIALVCLALVDSVGLSLSYGATRLARRAHEKSLPTHSLTAAYWSIKDGFTSSLVLVNMGDSALTVNPTLYNLTGGSLEVSPIVVAAGQKAVSNIGDLVRATGAGPEFSEGSLTVGYDALEAVVAGQVEVTNATSSLAYHFVAEMPMSFRSSRLDGFWWRHADDTATLVLSNTSARTVSGQVSFFGAAGDQQQTSIDIVLAPHEVRKIELDDARLPFTPGTGGKKIGGVKVTHSGEPGDLLAHTLISRTKDGYSAQYRLEDLSSRASGTLAATHILVGQADVPGYSPATRFTSTALLRNTSDASIEVAPKVSFTTRGVSQTVALGVRRLLPGQVDSFDVGSLLARNGARGPYEGVGITLESTGRPSDLVAHLSSEDQTRDHVFSAPLKDPASSMNRSGGYPWTLEGESESIVHVRNSTDRESHFTIQLNYEGGSYALPVQTVAPQQQVAINIRQLRELQIPDSSDTTLPPSVSQGTVIWNEHGATMSGPQGLIGRVEVYDVSGAVASSFSCGYPCCQPVTHEVYTTPGAISGSVGSTNYVKLMETKKSNCSATFLGPYNVTSQASSWSTSDPACVTLGNVVTQGKTVNCVALGSSTVLANYTGSYSYVNYDDCFYSTYPHTAGLTVQVRPTASFASVDAIGKDAESEVFVQISPSPSSVNVTLTLEPVPGSMNAGSAVFTSNNSTTLTVNQAGKVKIKGTSASSMLDKYRIRASASGVDLATETFTVVQVTLSIRTNGTVSNDNIGGIQYNTVLGTLNLGTFQSSGTGNQLWRNGVELVGTISPSSYTGAVRLSRKIVGGHTYNGSANYLPAPVGDDTSDVTLRDDDPQSGGSGGKVYDLDAPGVAPSAAHPVGTILRMRVNFAQYAESPQGYRLSPDFAWYHRISVKKTATGNVLDTTIAGDNKASAGMTNTTWNLQ
jgi:hypothetical protein